jgi:hypothetical protein
VEKYQGCDAARRLLATVLAALCYAGTLCQKNLDGEKSISLSLVAQCNPKVSNKGQRCDNLAMKVARTILLPREVHKLCAIPQEVGGRGGTL